MESYDASRLVRRLIPYPGAAEAIPSVAMSTLAPAGYQQQSSRGASGAAPAAAVEAVGSIVSEAASILDEEMAKGVLAARSSGQGPRSSRSDSSTTSLRQLHDLLDNVADLWPGLAGAPGPSSTVGAAANPTPEVKPRSPARAGERAIIRMTLRNSENRSVRMVPIATDLLGDNGDRIAGRLLQFAPGEIQLGAGEQRDLEIGVTIPMEARPGCYAGVLVVTGVSYLRALITIEVR